MKKRIALSILAVALLAFAVGCDLYTGISVTWSVNSYSVSASPVHVTYTVHNVGQYDLTGVNLEIGVDTGAGFYYTAWTADFSLAKGQTLTGSIDVPTNSALPLGATVLSIDMDKPA